MEIQQASADQDADISVESDGGLVFETHLVTITNVAGDVDQSDLGIGILC